MWSDIWSTVLNYWVLFVLGICGTGITIFFRRFWKMYQKERKEEQHQIVKEFEQKHEDLLKEVDRAMWAGRDESKEDDAVLQRQIDGVGDQLDLLKAGLLSMQGKEFRANCRKLLEDGHVITLDEWEEIDSDHEAYNGLGGNHKGDYLFSLVKKKAENTLTDVE